MSELTLHELTISRPLDATSITDQRATRASNSVRATRWEIGSRSRAAMQEIQVPALNGSTPTASARTIRIG